MNAVNLAIQISRLANAIETLTKTLIENNAPAVDLGEDGERMEK